VIRTLCAAAGDFLQPDEITFAVMLRGYGSQNPPDWQKIDSVLTQMKMSYGLEPSASEQQQWHSSSNSIWSTRVTPLCDEQLSICVRT
jgi:hypothetical protein